jgi:hypothetical protein
VNRIPSFDLSVYQDIDMSNWIVGNLFGSIVLQRAETYIKNDALLEGGCDASLFHAPSTSHHVPHSHSVSLDAFIVITKSLLEASK